MRIIAGGISLIIALLTGPVVFAAEPTPQNLYRSSFGVSEELVSRSRESLTASPVLNPSYEGQVLLAPLFDVRMRDGDSQLTNIQVWNRNTSDDNLRECTDEDFDAGVDGTECYNPFGGIAMRVRFRESRESAPALSFAVALGCSATWTARVKLGEDDIPEVQSKSYLVDETGSQFEELNFALSTDPRSIRVFDIPVDDSEITDWQRGHFEVIAIEALPCHPTKAGESPATGGGIGTNRTFVWQRPQPFGIAPSNALAAKVFIVQPGSGRSYSYKPPAISRFVSPAAGPIPVPGGLLGSPDLPDLRDCRTYPDRRSPELASPFECISAINLAISSAELHGQFDIARGIGASTRVAIVQPTRHYRCDPDFREASRPFSCSSQGEEITCRVYDRSGNSLINPLSPDSPPDGAIETCRLPRDLSILSLRQSEEDAEEDWSLWTTNLPRPQSGKFALDLARNPAHSVIHREEFPRGGNFLNIHGSDVEGYWGLPALGLVIQEFTNGEVGGRYGNTTAAGSFQTPLRCR